MKIFLYLFLFFVLVANVELFTFLYLGKSIGLLPTLVIIIGTGMIGAYLAKKEGLKSWSRIKAALAHGQNPSKEMINGLCILLAGIALCIPGFISDICGLILIIPFVRKHLVPMIARRWQPLSFLGLNTQFDNDEDTTEPNAPTPFRHTGDDDDVIDVEPMKR